MRWRSAPFALLLLAGCDAQPVLESPIACQQRIIDIRVAQQIAPEDSGNVALGFERLAKAYASTATTGCSDAQKRRIEQLKLQSEELSRLAEAATKAGQSAANRKTRLPNSDAHIAFMTALQNFENRQAQLRRELREMQADNR